MKVNLHNSKTKNQTSPNLPPPLKRRTWPKAKAMTSVNHSCRQAVNVSIKCVVLKRSIRKFVQELRRTNTDSSAKTVMKIISTIFTANSVNRFTPTAVRIKMMTNGSAVIIVKDGY